MSKLTEIIEPQCNAPIGAHVHWRTKVRKCLLLGRSIDEAATSLTERVNWKKLDTAVFIRRAHVMGLPLVTDEHSAELDSERGDRQPALGESRRYQARGVFATGVYAKLDITL